MKIAVTYENGEIFQHFGHTPQFKIYEFDDGDKVLDVQLIDTTASGHSALAGVLVENGVNVLICGGIGGCARTALAEAGIELCAGVVGGADSAVVAYLKHSLVFNSEATCDHHGEEHDHACGSHCGGDCEH